MVGGGVTGGSGLTSVGMVMIGRLYKRGRGAKDGPDGVWVGVRKGVGGVARVTDGVGAGGVCRGCRVV